MKRRDEVLVGLTATLAIAAGVVGSLWLARGGLQPGYPLYAKFTWGAGLKQGQPVLLSGVNVGYVDGVDIRPDGLLIVKLRVRKNYHVPLGTTATIEPNGFFGDQLVALKPAGPNPRTYAPSDTLVSGRPTPQIGDVLARVDTIAGNVVVLTTSLRQQFAGDKGFSDLHETLKRAGSLMDEISKVAAQQNQELTRTQESLRKVGSAVDSTRIDSTLRALSGAANNVAALAADVHETTLKLNSTLAKLSDGQGSASKLMNDPALFNDMRSLMTRLDSLTADFKKNPRKYIKLSIF
jgi:phospholipid/cholesterol/gamma-HCH transport system substrate-binding protein